jgi:alpha-mannosidase
MFTITSAFAGEIDITKNKTLFVVGYSHLDSQWRWDYKQTINKFLKNKLEGNFALFEKYPKNSFDGNMQDGLTYPAKQLPDNIVSENIQFEIGYPGNQSNNAVTCSGQEITLPDDPDYNKLYILEAANKDTRGIFTLGNKEYNIQIQKWNGFVGQYDNRIWNSPYDKVVGLEPGYIKKDNIAWFATHTHSPGKGNLVYNFCYLYKYSLDLNGAEKLVLPDNEKIKVFAVTVA